MVIIRSKSYKEKSINVKGIKRLAVITTALKTVIIVII